MWEVECPFFEMIKNPKILKEHQARIGPKHQPTNQQQQQQQKKKKQDNCLIGIGW